MEKLTVEMVENMGMLVFKVISGSRAYGLHTEKSDVDIKGIFVLPEEQFYGLEYIPQVTNESNDVVYYELRRFMELLSKSNPNIIEMLGTQQDSILLKDKIMSHLDAKFFLSRQCEETFANYAFTQVKKASGLEKKIVNPMAEHRKSVNEFCYVYDFGKVTSLERFLGDHNIRKENVGLASIAHLRDCYNIYYSLEYQYNGVSRKEDVNDVCLSNIPKGQKPLALLYFNKDAYSVYCRQHKEYWDWVAKRNEVRFGSTMEHGKKYDAKNMMHVFRLLKMAREIATEQTINVSRADRDFLLGIKSGKYGYEELVKMAEDIKAELPLLYANSSLPMEPDKTAIEQLLIKMRKQYYSRTSESTLK